jgi:hypothetical protein
MYSLHRSDIHRGHRFPLLLYFGLATGSAPSAPRSRSPTSPFSFASTYPPCGKSDQQLLRMTTTVLRPSHTDRTLRSIISEMRPATGEKNNKELWPQVGAINLT